MHSSTVALALEVAAREERVRGLLAEARVRANPHAVVLLVLRLVAPQSLEDELAFWRAVLRARVAIHGPLGYRKRARGR